jgi:hypothetical protein
MKAFTALVIQTEIAQNENKNLSYSPQEEKNI